MANKNKYESVLCKIAGHNENDLTRMFAVILNYNKSSLKRLLEHAKLLDYLIDEVLISTQFRDISYVKDSVNDKKKFGGIFDLEINLKNCFKIIIEAKLQSRPDNLEQLERYANKLKEEKNNEKFPIVKLIFLTKYNEEMKYNALKSKNILSENEIIYIRWMEKVNDSCSIFDLMNESMDKSNKINNDFLEYLKELATPTDECYIGIVRNNSEFINLKQTLTYGYTSEDLFSFEERTPRDYSQLRQYLENEHYFVSEVENIDENVPNIIKISNGAKLIELVIHNDSTSKLIIDGNESEKFELEQKDDRLFFFEELSRQPRSPVAKFFLPYKHQTNFKREGLEGGISHYAKIKQINEDGKIIIESLNPFPKNKIIKLSGRSGNSHFDTSFEIIKKALYYVENRNQFLDNNHRLQKLEHWKDVKIPDTEEWRWLKEWDPEQLLIE